jgi:hypothetical protein
MNIIGPSDFHERYSGIRYREDTPFIWWVYAIAFLRILNKWTELYKKISPRKGDYAG